VIGKASESVSKYRRLHSDYSENARGVNTRRVVGMSDGRPKPDAGDRKIRLAMAGASHFHIKWTEKNRFDWQRFDDPSSAAERASELVQPGETFSVEQFSDECTVCRETIRGRFI
jgi:hypothetical protein